MDNERALFCLKQLVSAVSDETFDHVVKRVVVIVVQDNVPTFRNGLFQVDRFLYEGFLLRGCNAPYK